MHLHINLFPIIWENVHFKLLHTVYDCTRTVVSKANFSSVSILYAI